MCAMSRFAHTEKRMKTSYYIARVDPCVHLVLLLEGKRRPTEKTTQVRLLMTYAYERVL